MGRRGITGGDEPFIDLDETEQGLFWGERWDQDPDGVEDETDPAWLGWRPVVDPKPSWIDRLLIWVSRPVHG
ncbi:MULTISPECIES: hypothetical protein [Brevundimonas]|uniref:hypothetical protein n=1 Tax=Brevundimonas TaxID=41275 RepID=UPI000F017158|nr:hypothetical protein [Brevundimonas lutea]